MLADLIQRVGGRCELNGQGPEITGVQLDSRAVGPGDLFVALEGEHSDGRAFISAAVAAGASAVLVQESANGDRIDQSAEVPVWYHGEAREAAGRAAAEVFDDPSRDLTVFAVTGTNGKTTTAHLIAELLTRSGKKPAVIGTTGYRLAGDEFFSASHTTPDAPRLQRMLARHRELGGDCVVLEVSSHALAQRRIAGLRIDFAIFTNLSRDHLDYHGEMEQYAKAKSLMFSNLDKHAMAIINQDDEWSSFMVEAARGNGCSVYSYSADAPADLSASQLCFEPDATYLTLSGMGISLARLRIPLSGRFNVANALAASAAVLLSGASPSAVVEGLASVSSPPGRLESVTLSDDDGGGDSGRGARRTPRVFVDYAHTPDALANVLRTLREVAEGRLICVFGCGGDRDRGKRAEMGRVASKLSDLVIVTSDNPRSEEPESIMEDIHNGMTGASEVLTEVDRRRAIRAALRAAEPEDTILIAGKGHETEQVLADRTIDFDDRVVAREEWA